MSFTTQRCTVPILLAFALALPTPANAASTHASAEPALATAPAQPHLGNGLVRHQRSTLAPAAQSQAAAAGTGGPGIDVSSASLPVATRSALARWVADLGQAGLAIEFTALEPTGQRLAPAHPVLRLQQQVDGLPVHGATVALLFDGTGKLRFISGALAIQPAPDRSAGWHGDPEQAVRAAVAAATALDASNLGLRANGDRSGQLDFHLDRFDGLRAIAPVRTRPVWFPTGHGLRAAYEVQLVGSVPQARRPLAQRLLVCAGTGAVLRADQLVHDLRPLARPPACPTPCPAGGFQYRVLADRRGVPLTDPYGMTSPHPSALRDGHRPATPASPRLIGRRHGGIATGDPWLADDATTTAGNNVDAFFQALGVVGGLHPLDLFASWSPQFQAGRGDFRASTSGAGRFDYSYQVAQAPQDYFQRPGLAAVPVPTGSSQLRAKIVQAFYAGNWLHDLFYDLGFDEAAGNAQMDNFGRGGIAGDPLQIHAGFSTTFAFAPPDGTSPSITLGRNEFSLSNRDVSGFDFGVFAHEWAHTMFVRLTTMGPRGQQGALNEGTADFIGVFLMLEPGHRWAAPATGEFHGAYPLGAYMNLDYDFPFDDLPPAGSPGHPDNTYFHGIRRFPYSASLALNPLSFGHISPDNPLPPGAQPFDWKLRSLNPAEIHTAGEVWASALWQCARNIMAAAPVRQFGLRQRQVLADLVAALKLFPTDATYTEARNAMLAAVQARDEGDHLRCRAGFAQRGLGAGAQSPPRASVDLRGVVESFVDGDIPE